MVTHGQPLLQELQRALPTLSPKLGGVARFCIQHAATLHHYRIQDVADACDTMPVSVVRQDIEASAQGVTDLKALVTAVRSPAARSAPPPRRPARAPA